MDAIEPSSSSASRRLGSHHLVHEGRPADAEHLALLRQWWEALPHPRSQTEVLTLFVKRSAEARSRLRGLEAAHRVIALFDAAVVFFDAIVEVGATRCLTSSPSVSRIARG